MSIKLCYCLGSLAHAVLAIDKVAKLMSIKLSYCLGSLAHAVLSYWYDIQANESVA